MTAIKLDIFEVIKNINQKNFGYYDSLPKHLQKQFSPYMVYQWMISTKDPYQLIVLNEIPSIFKLSKHPGLVYRLFCIAAARSEYKWMFKTSSTDKVKVIADYLKCSKKDARLHEDFFSKDDILEMCSELGYQEAEIKKLKV
jgi:hypothetical protein